MKEHNKPFIIRMSSDLFEQLETANEKAIMLTILSFTDNGKGECWASMRKIADKAKCSKTEVHRVKQRLIKRGILEKVGKKKCIGGYTDILIIPSLSVPLRNASVPKTGVKCPKHRHNKQLKETNKLILSKKSSNREQEKLAKRIARWGTERAKSPSTKSIPAYMTDLLPYIKKHGCEKIEGLFEKETNNYRFWQGLKEL